MSDILILLAGIIIGGVSGTGFGFWFASRKIKNIVENPLEALNEELTDA